MAMLLLVPSARLYLCRALWSSLAFKLVYRKCILLLSRQKTHLKAFWSIWRSTQVYQVSTFRGTRKKLLECFDSCRKSTKGIILVIGSCPGPLTVLALSAKTSLLKRASVRRRLLRSDICSETFSWACSC
jgi:hypothetical protein